MVPKNEKIIVRKGKKNVRSRRMNSMYLLKYNTKTTVKYILHLLKCKMYRCRLVENTDCLRASIGPNIDWQEHRLVKKVVQLPTFKSLSRTTSWVTLVPDV